MGNDDCVEVTPSQEALDIIEHLAAFDDLLETRCYRWLRGRSYEELPALQVVEARAAGRVHYVTVGVSSIIDSLGYGLEFCLQVKQASFAHVELLAMVAFMHSDPEHRLWIGHTLNVGRPVDDGSDLDRLLISLPYPYGDEFEFVHLSDGRHVRILWLLPISMVEEKFRHEHGLEQLESKFDDRELDYLDFHRASVV